MEISTPDAVPNQLVRASWGDAVRADLTALNNEKLSRTPVAGHPERNTMTAMLLLPGTNPSNVNHAVRKGWVDATFLQVDGGNKMVKELNMGGFRIIGVANPTAASDAMTLSHANATYINRTGDTMTGILTLDGTDATGANAAMRRAWIVGLVNDTEASIKSWANGRFALEGHDHSDPRLKEVVEPITDAGARIQELARKAFRGRWVAQKGEGPLEDMLAAPDIAVAAPYVVKGEPDAVDEQGNPKYMTVAYPHLVPLLIAALGEALDRIEQLEGRADDDVAADDLSA